MSEIVKEDGTVRIPEAIRVRLGLVPGMAIDFEPAGEGQVRLVVLDKPRNRFEVVRGMLKGGRSTDEIMRESRGEM